MKAFPSTEPVYKNDIVGMKASFGMDLRDYFAAKAMQAFLSRSDTSLVINKTETSLIAYLMADAMMEARNGK
jgi:hypothetical protein